MINLQVVEIEDSVLQENFRKIQNYINTEAPILMGEWLFFEQSFPVVVTGYRLRHGLGFVPKDILLTNKTGTGDVTFDYENFTKEHIIFTTTGPCSFRFFAGRFEKRKTF